MNPTQKHKHQPNGTARRCRRRGRGAGGHEWHAAAGHHAEEQRQNRRPGGLHRPRVAHPDECRAAAAQARHAHRLPVLLVWCGCKRVLLLLHVITCCMGAGHQRPMSSCKRQRACACRTNAEHTYAWKSQRKEYGSKSLHLMRRRIRHLPECADYGERRTVAFVLTGMKRLCCACCLLHAKHCSL